MPTKRRGKKAGKDGASPAQSSISDADAEDAFSPAVETPISELATTPQLDARASPSHAVEPASGAITPLSPSIADDAAAQWGALDAVIPPGVQPFPLSTEDDLPKWDEGSGAGEPFGQTEAVDVSPFPSILDDPLPENDLPGIPEARIDAPNLQVPPGVNPFPLSMEVDLPKWDEGDGTGAPFGQTVAVEVPAFPTGEEQVESSIVADVPSFPLSTEDDLPKWDEGSGAGPPFGQTETAEIRAFPDIPVDLFPASPNEPQDLRIDAGIDSTEFAACSSQTPATPDLKEFPSRDDATADETPKVVSSPSVDHGFREEEMAPTVPLPEVQEAGGISAGFATPLMHDQLDLNGAPAKEASEALSGPVPTEGFSFLPPPPSGRDETGFAQNLHEGFDDDFDAPFQPPALIANEHPLPPNPSMSIPESNVSQTLPEEPASFGSTPFLPPPPTAGAGVPSDDDDFSDFGDFSTNTPSATVVPPAIPEAGEADDDFGDFEDFAPPPPVTATGLSVPNAPAQRNTVPEEPTSVADPVEEQRIWEILSSVAGSNNTNLALLSDVNAKLAKIFPAVARAADTAPATFGQPQPIFEERPLSGSPVGPTGGTDRPKAIVPNSAFQGTSWYALWNKLASDTIYSDNPSTQFRWRKSHIRRAYLHALDINIILDEAQQQTPVQAQAPRASIDYSGSFAPGTPSTSGAPRLPGDGSAADKGKTPRDSREMELLEAKKLCDVAEEEIRQQTVAQLAALVANLTSSHQKMQDQANYWLDSKEQLIMDAEMHNKMIASLVQYAQQQQTAPKASPRSTSPGKKGRR
ncbi:hypothetical protein HKX48_007510 [Thoreauomyces humboldtii]|nr:hypothetical protein HKX48_007510 [Thoreauomyces humboldtii]